jgi:hypothetical protein
MLRVARCMPQQACTAARTEFELRSSKTGFASSRSSRAAAQQHCSSQMTIASMYALKAAATDVDDDLHLEHQRCQTSGGMPGDRPEAVAVCAGRLRSVAAASTTAPNGLQMAPKLVSNSTSRNLDGLFDVMTVDISIERPNLARGIPHGPRGVVVMWV